MPARFKPVAYDKSIHKGDNGGYILVIREDDDYTYLRMLTLEQAQKASDCLPSDGGDYPGGPFRSAFFSGCRRLQVGV